MIRCESNAKEVSLQNQFSLENQFATLLRSQGLKPRISVRSWFKPSEGLPKPQLNRAEKKFEPRMGQDYTRPLEPGNARVEPFCRGSVCIDGCLVQILTVHPRANLNSPTLSFRCVCVPSSIQTIAEACFRNCETVSFVAFEKGCQLSVLDEHGFDNCSLRSICIPSSITTICASCFSDCGSLSTVLFEPGSKLRSIGPSAFHLCARLKSLFLPAGVCEVTGLSMDDSGIENVIVDPENAYFRVCGDFLLDFRESCMVRYFGRAADVSISNVIEVIGVGCFSYCRSLLSVRFEAGCRISLFGESAFQHCSSLQSICIPSSVETISKSCFYQCYDLLKVTFEPDSKVSVLGDFAFEYCQSLRSICIPPLIEIIPLGCFSCCNRLSHFAFAPGCRVSTLGRSAFGFCSSLQSIRIPASVETISPACFGACCDLKNIVLEVGCKVSVDSLSPPAGARLITVMQKSGPS
jgi:hypothetical protein